MIRKLFWLIGLLMPICASAQYQIKEDFEESMRLGWEEYAEKDGSTLLQPGYLELISLKKDSVQIAQVHLPISVEHDFSIKSKLIVPKLNEEDRFGIIIDMDEEFNKLVFLLCEKFASVHPFNSGKIVYDYGDNQRIKLEGGKNQVVEVELLKRGKNLIFNVNNITWKSSVSHVGLLRLYSAFIPKARCKLMKFLSIKHIVVNNK